MSEGDIMTNEKDETIAENEECGQIRVVGGKISGFKTFIKEDNMWSNLGTKEKFGSTDEIKNHYAEKGKRKVFITCE